MKTLIMIIAISLASICTTFAQQDNVEVGQHRHNPELAADTLSSQKKVETRTYNNVLSKVTVTEVHNDSVIESSMLSINLPWFPTVSRSSSNGSFSDESSWTWTWHGPEYSEHMSDIYFAFAFMADKNFPVNSVKSWEWGLYPLSGVLLHSHNYQRLLTWGFGFSRTSFKLKDQAPYEDAPGYTSQRFRYWSWRLPVCAEFQSQNHSSFFSLGLEAELRHHVRARNYGDALANSNMIVVGHNKDLINPWACNLLMQAGSSEAGIIARLSLTDLFDQNATHLKAMPFSIGLSLGF